MTLLYSCEHASNSIPADFHYLFIQANEVLASHRGWDPGAIGIAEVMKAHLQAPLFTTTVSRLLVEVNRSVGHGQLFSEFTQSLSAPEKESLLRQFYFPYRNAVEDFIRASAKPVLHFSIHTFTPVWKGENRLVDVGLLFDPSRKLESQVCKHLLEGLQAALPLAICFNEPYQGTDDGFTTYLRTQFANEAYSGVEIEVNQKFLGAEQIGISQALAQSIARLSESLA